MKTETNQNTNEGHDANTLLAVSGPLLSFLEWLTANYDFVDGDWYYKTDLDGDNPLSHSNILNCYRAACDGGALDTVAARGTCEHECTGPWDCQCQDVIDSFYRGVERKSSEGQL